MSLPHALRTPPERATPWWRPPVAARPLAVAALAGLSLSLIHFVTLTEFPSLVGSNELVALIVLFAYFLGLSVGYLVSDRLSVRQLQALGLAAYALHLTLPFSTRVLAGTLWRINLQGDIPPLVFLVVLLGVTPLYAVFLPRLIDAASAGEEAPGGDGARLGWLYATEILGSLVGLALALVVTPARIGLLLGVHLASVGALLALLSRRPARWLPLCAVPALYLALFPSLDRRSLEYFYKHRRGFREVTLLASEFSPYQRVDLFRARPRRGKKSATYLYLNGNLLYGSGSLHVHNLMVSILPGLLPATPPSMLVISGGSLDAVRYLAPRVGHLRVVELDETVVRLARRYIQEPRGGFPAGWDLTIDDGKHFLGSHAGPPFDVIAVDVPVPSYLQTAALHSDRFFALARSRLAPGGIFSISLSGSLSGSYDEPRGDDDGASHLGHRVMAGLLRHFAHVAVVMADGQAFAWASDRPLGLDDPALAARLEAFLEESHGREVFGAPRLHLLDDATARSRAAGFAPIGEADMQVVLRLSVNKLVERFYEPTFD